MGGAFFPALFLVVVVAATVRSQLPPLFLGIAPEDEEYFSRESIPCRDGSRSFPKDRLNDGYCDCPDGTDEPGTSACPESRFYCRNLGDNPRILYSSRVNDRICDCCDGTDEYDGHITCRNTCSTNSTSLNNGTDVAISRSSHYFHEYEHAKRRAFDLEKVVENLTDLRIAIVFELVIVSVLISCFFKWHARSRRRLRWLRA